MKDNKNFGLPQSLIDTVVEAIKGKQKNLDVAEPKGKLTSADFKALRSGKKDLQQEAATCNMSEAGKMCEVHGMKACPGMKEEVEQVDEKYMGFKKLEKSIAAKGDVRDPGAVAAAIGRKKYGKKKFQKAATSDHKMKGMKPAHEEVEQVDERELTPAETRKKEEIVKSMKKGTAGFKKRYGDRWKEVMYATATSRAKGKE
jgi:hypothetical protein